MLALYVELAQTIVDIDLKAGDVVVKVDNVDVIVVME